MQVLDSPMEYLHCTMLRMDPFLSFPSPPSDLQILTPKAYSFSSSLYP